MRLKRALDLLFALSALAVLWPVLAVVAAAILITDGRPILFSQTRSGQYGEPFVLSKFRTMSVPVDPSAPDFDPTTDAVRITGLGARLRAWSLDELPTLWAVARGDLSLVGPRPLPVHYLERYSPTQRRRLEVPPGITGLAQVHGRNLLSWEERFALDVTYVDSWSFIGDIRLLLQTILPVLRREGVAAEGVATMTEFMGNPASGSGDDD